MLVINVLLNGIDLIKVNRFAALKNKNSFMNSIFNIEEIKYIEKCNHNTATIAGLYASKEAFLKAIKKGIHNYPLKDIEISHDNNNAPFIILHNQLAVDFQLKNISLSISHDGDYAIAIVSILL